ncbi:tail fiber assembly protein [Leminorella grimontii]|uniref:tail fiber assembly protein n=1 Tax=Leminorella grimontii TaxID=82981 RepID=UPI00321FC62C
MVGVQFNDLGFAKLTGTVHLYHVAPDSGEFLFESDEWVSVGVGIPAYSCIDVPLSAKPGFAVCRINDNWEYVEDHRGVEAYSTQTQKPIEITMLGPLPADVTTLHPATPFDCWNGDNWVTDEAAKHQAEVEAAARQKRDLEQKANAAIETLNDAIELGLAEQGDEEMLKAWRAYRVKLSRVDVQAAPGVTWPALPAD